MIPGIKSFQNLTNILINHIMNHLHFSQTLLIAFAGILITSHNVSAQKVNSLYFLDNTPVCARLNPAMTPAYSGFGVGLSNLSISVKSDLAMDDIFYPGENGELNTFLSPDVDKEGFLNKLNDVTNFKFEMNTEFISVGIHSKDNFFSFHSGINMDMGLGLPKDLFRLVLIGMDDNAASTKFDLSSVNMNMMLYNKTGVGFAKKIGDKFSIGINLDYLTGLADARIGFDKMTIDASSSSWTVSSVGYMQLAGPKELSMTYSNDGYFNGIQSNYNSKSLGTTSMLNSNAGEGYSMDIGMKAKVLDFLTLSAAITDIGKINWKKDYIQKAASDKTFTYEGFSTELSGSSDNSQTFEKVSDDLQDLTRFEKVSVTDGYSTKLTTKLNIGAEAGILNNRITLGLLSQTGFSSNDKYHDLLVSANFKPGSLFQGALSYSLLHGSMSSFGAAMNVKLLCFDFYVAADYIPMIYSKDVMLPSKNSYLNTQVGMNFMF